MKDLQVKITTTADTAGAKATAEALQGVSKTTAAASQTAREATRVAKDQAAGAGDAARSISTLGETTEKGIGIGRIFAEVARGNFLALLNLSAALKGLGAAMKTNVVGILLLAVTALGNFLLALRGTKKEVDETEPSFEGLAAAVAKLNQAKLDALKAEIQGLNEQLRGAEEFFNKVQAAAAKIDKAREALEIAQIEANPALSPEQKKSAIYAVRQRFAGQARDREAAADQARIDRAQQAAAETARIAAQADTNLAATVAQNRELIDAPKQIAAEIAALTQELASLQKTPGGTSAAAMARGDRMAAIGQRLGVLGARQETSRSLDVQAEIAAAKNRITGAEEASRLAREAAVKADRELFNARGDASLNQTTRAMVGGLEARTARVQAGLPEPVSRISSTSEIIGGLTSVRGFNGEAVGNRIADLVQQKMREGEEAIVRAVERRLQENQRIQEQQAKALRR